MYRTRTRVPSPPSQSSRLLARTIPNSHASPGQQASPMGTSGPDLWLSIHSIRGEASLWTFSKSQWDGYLIDHLRHPSRRRTSGQALSSTPTILSFSSHLKLLSAGPAISHCHSSADRLSSPSSRSYLRPGVTRFPGPHAVLLVAVRRIFRQEPISWRSCTQACQKA